MSRTHRARLLPLVAALLALLLPGSGPAAAGEPPPNVPGATPDQAAVLRDVTDALAQATGIEEQVRSAADRRDPAGWARLDALDAILDQIESRLGDVDHTPGETAARIARWGHTSLATRRGIHENLTRLVEDSVGARGASPPRPPPPPEPAPSAAPSPAWGATPPPAPPPAPVAAGGTAPAPAAGPSPWGGAPPPTPRPAADPAPPLPAPPPSRSAPAAAPARPAPADPVASRPAPPPPAAAPIPPPPAVEGMAGLKVGVAPAFDFASAAQGRRIDELMADGSRVRTAPRPPATPRESLDLRSGEALVISVPAGTLREAGIVDLRLAVVGRGQHVDRRVEIVHPALADARRRLERTGALSIPPDAFVRYLDSGEAPRRLEHGEVLELQLEYAGLPAPIPFYFRKEAPASWSGVQLPVLFAAAVHFPGVQVGSPPAFAVVPSLATGVRLAADDLGRHVVDVNGWIGLALPVADPRTSAWRAPGIAAGLAVGFDGVAQVGLGADFLNGAVLFGASITPIGWKRIGIPLGP
ncbi:hypothetical protein L6R50_16460 [Myxococcota bacterium]|nr:hypothetical protein [Myxococcota bacterium]